MTHKDVDSVRGTGANWKRRLSIVLLVTLVLGVSLSVRYFDSPESASAQTPRTGRQTANRQRPGTSATTRAQTPRRVSGKSAAQANQASTSNSRAKQIVAVVNRQNITRLQLARECLRRFGEDVLETVINRHLIIQACKQRGIAISKQDVDKEIGRLATNLGLTAEQFLKVIQDDRNISPEQYRNDITWPMLALRRLAADQLNVGSDELQQAFETQYGSKVQVRMIATATRDKAEQLRRQAMANPDAFGDLAKNHSEDVNSAAGRGLIPPIRRHVGDKVIEEAVFQLKQGEISAVVPAAGQFFVFKCERLIPAMRIGDKELQVVQDHLTEQIRERKLRESAATMLEQLQGNAKVVNVYNNPGLRKSMPGVAATINGQKISLNYVAEQCVVRHGDEVLDGEINRLLLSQALRARNLKVTEDDIDYEIDRAAEAYGFLTADQKPNRKAWLEHVTTEQETSVDLYVRDAVWPSVALKKLVSDKIQITDEDIQKGFISNYGPRVRVLAIVVSNRHQANEVWKMAKNNKSDRFFGELAHEYSIEPVSRNNFGQVPPIRRYGGQPLLEEEAFSLGDGNELSGVLSVGDKFIILRYLGTTKPVVTQLEDVRDELVKDIREKKLRLAMSQKFDELKARAQIDNLLAGKSKPSRGHQTIAASHDVPVRARK